MRAFRIYDQDAPWAKQVDFDALDGEGAMHGSARWHHKGTRVAYAACVASLALLEILVHVNPADFGERTLLAFDLPDDAVELVTHAQLIQLLRDAPARRSEAETRRFGTAWAQEHRSLALRVPSIVMPQDHDLIVDPLHPRMNEVVRQASERITLDPRLRLERLRERRDVPTDSSP